MRKITDPDFVYRPWSEERRLAARSRALERIHGNLDKVPPPKRSTADRVREIHGKDDPLDWRPIETVPKDGTLIIVRDEDGRRHTVSFDIKADDFFPWKPIGQRRGCLRWDLFDWWMPVKTT